MEDAVVERDRENDDGDQFCDCFQYRFGKALQRRHHYESPELGPNCGVVGKLARAVGALLNVMRDLLQGARLEFAVPGSAEHQTYFAAFSHQTVALHGGYGSP
jgi:hypothetical protein